MIVEELLSKKEPISLDTKMITNLQNLKHILKKTYKDSELLKFLTSFEFTDDLINEHLGGLNQSSDKVISTPKYVPRDSEIYRNYMKKLDNVRDRYDPYTNYFLMKAANKNLIKEAKENVDKSLTLEEKKSKQEILDNLLLSKEFHENSNINIGTHVIKNYDLNYDMNTLIRDENDYNVDPDLYAADITDHQYLNKQRRLAESNLIKTKIITKLHHDEPLSESEKKYLKAWRSKIGASMIPKSSTKMTLGNLSDKDSNIFNSLPLIEISDLKDYSLNDIILELNHFIDSNAIATIEKEVHIETLKSEWGLPKDFTVNETRHKEIDLVLGEIEENAYRHAAKFDENEIDGLKKVFT